jgi:hypothetical protein
VVTYALGLDIGGTDNGGYIVQVKNNTFTDMFTAINSTFTGRNVKFYMQDNTFDPNLLNPGVSVFPYTRSFAQGAGAYPHRINKRKVFYGPEEPTWKQGKIMALEKVISVDLIEVVENGTLQVRTKTAIMEDGKQISGTFHRHVVAPGADYSARMQECKRSVRRCIRMK